MQTNCVRRKRSVLAFVLTALTALAVFPSTAKAQYQTATVTANVRGGTTTTQTPTTPAAQGPRALPLVQLADI